MSRPDSPPVCDQRGEGTAPRSRGRKSERPPPCRRRCLSPRWNVSLTIFHRTAAAPSHICWCVFRHRICTRSCKRCLSRGASAASTRPLSEKCGTRSGVSTCRFSRATASTSRCVCVVPVLSPVTFFVLLLLFVYERVTWPRGEPGATVDAVRAYFGPDPVTRLLPRAPCPAPLPLARL